jgi:hypothetical protein
MNYEVIKDDKMLKDFIDWLPDLKSNETYYVSLFSRKKYTKDPNLQSDKSQLKRFTSTKQYLFSKIKQLECVLGAYTTNGYPIPQESIAVYISLNPRDLEKATKASMIKFAHLIAKNYNGYNPHQEVMSMIQTSGGCKKYMDFDFDNISLNEVLSQLKGVINIDCVRILNTRGGFHLLVELDKVEPEFKNLWYKSISAINGCDVRGSDNLIPIPGCTQGNFVPHFISLQ